MAANRKNDILSLILPNGDVVRKRLKSAGCPPRSGASASRSRRPVEEWLDLRPKRVREPAHGRSDDVVDWKAKARRKESEIRRLRKENKALLAFRTGTVELPRRVDSDALVAIVNSALGPTPSLAPPTQITIESPPLRVAASSIPTEPREVTPVRGDIELDLKEILDLFSSKPAVVPSGAAAAAEIPATAMPSATVVAPNDELSLRLSALESLMSGFVSDIRAIKADTVEYIRAAEKKDAEFALFAAQAEADELNSKRGDDIRTTPRELDIPASSPPTVVIEVAPVGRDKGKDKVPSEIVEIGRVEPENIERFVDFARAFTVDLAVTVAVAWLWEKLRIKLVEGVKKDQTTNDPGSGGPSKIEDPFGYDGASASVVGAYLEDGIWAIRARMHPIPAYFREGDPSPAGRLLEFVGKEHIHGSLVTFVNADTGTVSVSDMARAILLECAAFVGSAIPAFIEQSRKRWEKATSAKGDVIPSTDRDTYVRRNMFRAIKREACLVLDSDKYAGVLRNGASWLRGYGVEEGVNDRPDRSTAGRVVGYLTRTPSPDEAIALPPSTLASKADTKLYASVGDAAYILSKGFLECKGVTRAARLAATGGDNGILSEVEFPSTLAELGDRFKGLDAAVIAWLKGVVIDAGLVPV